MSTPLIVNGVTFQYPVQGDKNWGPTLTNWSTAVTSGMLQKAGGSFPLTAEVDFGASFGMKVLSIKSEETNIATTGYLRLANASTGIVWRNAANNANLVLTVNSSNQLTFNGVNVGATTSLTNSHILVGDASNQPADVAMSGDITITNAGVTAIGAGKIVNAQVNAAAAIAVSKLAALTSSKVVVTDGSGVITTQSSPTLTELGYVGGVTSALQTQLNTITSNYLPLAGGTMSGVLNMGSQKITSLANGAAAGEALQFSQQGVNVLQGESSADFPTSSATPVTITGVTVTITPKTVASRFWLSFMGVIHGGALGNTIQVGFYRNGSLVKVFYLFVGALTSDVQVCGQYVDSPATTSALTYDVRISISAGATVTVGDGTSKSLIVNELYS